MLKCHKCKTFNRINTKFWMSKIDAVGFIILSLLLSVPIGFLSFVAEESQGFSYFIAFLAIVIAAIGKEYKIIALLILELFIDLALYENGFYEFSLMVATAFIFTFIKIGGKIYKFFFMCVNYKLNLNIFCKTCNKVYKNINLPR